MSDFECYSSWTSSSTGYGELRAHLIGGDCVTSEDLVPSAISSAGFFVIAIALVWYRWWRLLNRHIHLLECALGIAVSAVAWAVRAAMVNTATWRLSLSTLLAEQVLFILGNFILLDSVITLTRDVVPVLAIGHRRRVYFVLLSRFVLLVALALYAAAFAQFGSLAEATSARSRLSTNLRLAASVLTFALAALNLAYLLLEKIKYPELSFRALGILAFSAACLLVATLYPVTQTVIADESSFLVTSRLWFYITWSGLQGVAVLPMIALDISTYAFPRTYWMSKALDAELEAAAAEQALLR